MLEIRTKEDLLIPFNKIGEEGWEVKTRVILESLAENSYKTLPSPKTEAEFNELEKRLGTSLPENLKLFYLTFGIPSLGEELQPFEEIGWLKDMWIENPEYGPDFTEKEKEYLPFLITFSNYLGNGNMFCFHAETKEIYYYDHDQEPKLVRMFDKVDDYIKGCLIFAQSDFSAKSVDQEIVQKWAKEILIDLFGNEVVHKWHYFDGWS